MTSKHKSHTVQHIPTPRANHTTSEAVGWTIASLIILGVPLLCMALAVAVIRYVWKKGSKCAET